MLKNQSPKSKRGFTLIELLVVIAIIGLLSAIILVALNISRTRSRDARRIADLKQVKIGLDLYLNEGGGYPEDAVWVAGQLISCTSAFTRVPRDPLTPVYEYAYEAAGGSTDSNCNGNPPVYAGYRLEFYIENKDANYYMNEDGNVYTDAGVAVSWDSLLN